MHEHDNLEDTLRRALRETAAQIDPAQQDVPAAVAVTSINRRSRGWIPALAAAAVVLLIVGVVTVLDRDDNSGIAGTSADEIPLFLPEGVEVDPIMQPVESAGGEHQAVWGKHTVGPYDVSIYCAEYRDGSCHSLVGNARAYFATDGTPVNGWEDAKFDVMIRWTSPDLGEQFEPMDLGVWGRGMELTEVDINGHVGTVIESRLPDGTLEPEFEGNAIIWFPQDHTEVSVTADEPPNTDTLEFARSLVEHPMAVPDELPIQISPFDDLLVMAGAWDPPPTGPSPNGEVPQDACINAEAVGGRGGYAWECAEVGSLTWWEIPDMLGAFEEFEGLETGDLDFEEMVAQLEADGDRPVLAPEDGEEIPTTDGDGSVVEDPEFPPSGYVVGTAPIEAKEVDVTFGLPDGSTSTERVDVVGTEYGFTAGFFAADGGEGASVEDVVVVGELPPDPAPDPADQLTLYLPQGASLEDSPPPLDPTIFPPDWVEATRVPWVTEIGPYRVDLWCESYTSDVSNASGVCTKVSGMASTTFEHAMPEGSGPLKVEVAYLGDPSHPPAMGAGTTPPFTSGSEPRDAGVGIDVDGVPATYWHWEGPTEELVLRLHVADDLAVTVRPESASTWPGDVDDLVEFARTLKAVSVPVPDPLPVAIGVVDGYDDGLYDDWSERVIAGAFTNGVDGDARACVHVGSYPHCGEPNTISWSFEENFGLHGIVAGIVPIDADEISVRITYVDAESRDETTRRTEDRTVAVVGSAYGMTSGFFWIDVGRGYYIENFEILY